MPTAEQKMVREVGSLCWKDLSVEDVEEYLSLPNNQAKLDFLAARLVLPEDPERKAIVLDLYLYTLLFTEAEGFTPDKISAAFSIIKDTHEQSIKNFWPVKRSFQHFQDSLLRHSAHRPPYSIGLFSTQDVQAFSTYTSKCYFRHYMLYKYAFTKKTEMAFSTIDTYTTSVPPSFLVPLGSGEDENAKLKKDEEAALAQLETVPTLITAEDLEKAGVPPEARDAVLENVNAKLEEITKRLESRFNAEYESIQAKLLDIEAARRPQ